MIFGLIGKKLSHSFSKSYFESKFSAIHLPYQYQLFEINNAVEIIQLKKDNPELIGLNVTIPFKRDVIEYLSEIDDAAKKIGAVNTIVFSNGKTKGYNTDAIGFEKSLDSFYTHNHGKNILVLGNGGSSKAVQYILQKKGWPYKVVSKVKSNETIAYSQLKQSMIDYCALIINTTPVGMYPNTADTLPITKFNYTNCQYYFDLIYNPEQTATAAMLKEKGVNTKNGLEMLHIQADASWEVWQQSITSL